MAREPKLSIRNGRLIDPASGTDEEADLHLAEGRILAVGAAPAGFQPDRTLDARGLILCPGLVDLSARLREPGHEQKGDRGGSGAEPGRGGAPANERGQEEDEARGQKEVGRFKEQVSPAQFERGLREGSKGQRREDLIPLVAEGNEEAQDIALEPRLADIGVPVPGEESLVAADVLAEIEIADVAVPAQPRGEEVRLAEVRRFELGDERQEARQDEESLGVDPVERDEMRGRLVLDEKGLTELLDHGVGDSVGNSLLEVDDVAVPEVELPPPSVDGDPLDLGIESQAFEEGELRF